MWFVLQGQAYQTRCSIFYPVDGGRRFVENTDTYLPNYIRYIAQEADFELTSEVDPCE
jgi:hypothetical protein